MLVSVHIGPVAIKTFGVMFALAFLAARALIARRLRELERPTDWAYELILAALIGGLVGSRVYFLAQNGTGGGLSATLFAGSGLVWYGGFLGGALAVAGWAYRRRFPALPLLDLTAPALALGYAIGRIGCQLSGDGDYGIPSHLPWAMAYPDGTVPTTVPVHPTPIYETLAMGLVAWWLWRRRDSFRPGLLFAWYLVLAGTERFLVEFIRRNSEVVAGLTAAQVESLAMIALGSAWLIVAARHGGLRAARSRDEAAATAPARSIA